MSPPTKLNFHCNQGDKFIRYNNNKEISADRLHYINEAQALENA